MAFMAQNVK